MLTTLALITTPAFAAGDITTEISQPASVHVYESGTWTVTVRNIGNQTVSNIVLNIDLPETHTSPQVYLMGTLGSYSSNCSRVGNNLSCNIGTLKRYKSTTVSFALALPEADEDLVINTSFTSSAQSPTSNDNDSHVAVLDNYDVSFSGDYAVTNSHCTGTSLTSYLECTYFPSSISTHNSIHHADGTISFPDYPDYSGSWSSDTPDHLVFTILDDLGAVAAEFEGWGVSSSCWEGITTFPLSTYISPYHVCVD